MKTFTHEELEKVADRLTDMILDKDYSEEEIKEEVRHSMDVMDLLKKEKER